MHVKRGLVAVVGTLAPGIAAFVPVSGFKAFLAVFGDDCCDDPRTTTTEVVSSR